MEEKPRDSNEAILDRESIMVIITQSIMIAAVSLFAYYWGFKYCGYDLDKSRALTFVTLITAELLRAYSVRSQRHSLFEIGFFTNKTMVMASCFSFFLLLIVIYIPQLQPVFRTFSLGVYDWSIVFRFALIPLIVGEAQKIIKLKLKRSKNA